MFFSFAISCPSRPVVGGGLTREGPVDTPSARYTRRILRSQHARPREIKIGLIVVAGTCREHAHFSSTSPVTFWSAEVTSEGCGAPSRSAKDASCSTNVQAACTPENAVISWQTGPGGLAARQIVGPSLAKPVPVGSRHICDISGAFREAHLATEAHERPPRGRAAHAVCRNGRRQPSSLPLSGTSASTSPRDVRTRSMSPNSRASCAVMK